MRVFRQWCNLSGFGAWLARIAPGLRIHVAGATYATRRYRNLCVRLSAAAISSTAPA